MNIVDVLNEIWTQILTVTSVFVMPDWGVVIGWLPVIILLGLVMPFLTFVALGSLIYVARKPRTKVVFEEGPRVAEIGPGGEPVFPVGLPHCRRDGLDLPVGHAPLRDLPRRARGHLSDVRARARRDHRHLHELRARPEGQDAGRRGPDDARTEAGRRGRGMNLASLSSTLFSHRGHLRRARVRGPCRPRGDAGQRPAAPAEPRDTDRPPACLRRRRDRVVRHRAGALGRQRTGDLRGAESRCRAPRSACRSSAGWRSARRCSFGRTSSGADRGATCSSSASPSRSR